MELPSHVAGPGSTSTQSLLTRLLSLSVRKNKNPQPQTVEEDGPSKGQRGLINLHVPSDGTIAVDLIFVHGLNGGSQSTWTHGNDASRYWPKAWLPYDEAFHDARIHAFGYSSGVESKSILDIADFSRSLLTAIHDAPTIPRGEQVPLILVGHSMGGLVIKKAYILSRQLPEFDSLSKRITTLFFLGTPHRGSDLSQTLHRIISLTGSRPFLSDLFPQSPAIQAINEEFPALSQSLRLFSFFETKPMNYGVGKGLIVEKESAVLNYPNERRTHLDANHRDVARFPSPRDPSYLTVRNALAAVIEETRHNTQQAHTQLALSLREKLCRFLDVQDAPEEELMTRDTLWLPGSCEWLLGKQSFLGWRDGPSSSIYWLQGRPGVGKSVIASRVVRHIQGLGRDCSYFFFSQGDDNKNNLGCFLRSMAYQLALQNPELRDMIVGISSGATGNNLTVGGNNHLVFWRKVFLTGILKTRPNKLQFWIIDAADECLDLDEMITLLQQAQELWPLRALVTSRHGIDAHAGITLTTGVMSERVASEDSDADISLFLHSKLSRLHPDVERRCDIVRQILSKAAGCFLWADLVQKELRSTHTAAGIAEVLERIPSGMDQLYQGILQEMALRDGSKGLVKTILTWVLCSFRPLSTEELRSAVQADLEEDIVDVERLISVSCGNLVAVDSRKRVQLVHLTVREVLTRSTLESEFKISLDHAHQRIAFVCLNQLSKNGTEILGPMRSARRTQSSHPSPLPVAMYALEYAFRHLSAVKPTSSIGGLLKLVVKFLSSKSVLAWIENAADQDDLYRIIQAGKGLAFLVQNMRRASNQVLAQDGALLLERWSEDLTYLVTRFGRRLREFPWSIHNIIPPLCPPASAVRKQFVSPFSGLLTQGLSAEHWDDCPSTTTYQKSDSPSSAVAVSERYVCFGSFSGKIFVYDAETFQKLKTLTHGEYVNCVAISAAGSRMASAGARTIKIWDTERWTEAHTLPVNQTCIAISFWNDDTTVYAALRNNTLLYYDLSEDEAVSKRLEWTANFEMRLTELLYRQPSKAVFSFSLGLLAVLYRNEDIILLDVESGSIRDIYEQGTGSQLHHQLERDLKRTPRPAGFVRENVTAILFRPAGNSAQMVAAYEDGALNVFDLETGGVVGSLANIFASTLALSADGRTLAVADEMGDTKLYDFPALHLLYALPVTTKGQAIKGLAFTADGLRLLELRARQCRLWEPSALLRQEPDWGPNDDFSTSSLRPAHTGHTPESPEISAICCAWRYPVVFCGRGDGSVHVYDMTGDPESQCLFTQNAQFSVFRMHFDDDSGLLTTADHSGNVVSRNIRRRPNEGELKWEASAELINIRNTTSSPAISEVLASGAQERLLVDYHDQADLWRFEDGKPTGSLVGRMDRSRYSHKTSASWATHPTQPSQLILVDNGAIKLYRWSSFAEIASVDVPGFVDPAIFVRPRCPLIVTVSVRPSKDLSSVPGKELHDEKLMLIWDANELGSGATALQPKQNLAFEDGGLDNPIGLANDRFVFLGKGFIVSSVAIDAKSPNTLSTIRKEQRHRTTEGQGRGNISPAPPAPPPPTLPDESENQNPPVVTRHFFLPDDWLGQSRVVEMDVSQGGEIFFVRASEVIVAKRGLSVSLDRE